MLSSQETTGTQDVPAPADADSFGSFEEGCLDLLCRQENTLSQLVAISKRRPLDSLELARKMLVSFLDFAELHFEAEEFKAAGDWLYDVHQRTCELEKMRDAQSFKFVRRMFGATVPSQEKVDLAHVQLRGHYVELYSEFFATCAKRFPQNSETLEQFLQSVATFLSELDRKW